MGTIGIIGGADGPTVVLLSGDFRIYIVIGIIIALILIIGVILKKRKHK